VEAAAPAPLTYGLTLSLAAAVVVFNNAASNRTDSSGKKRHGSITVHLLEGIIEAAPACRCRQEDWILEDEAHEQSIDGE